MLFAALLLMQGQSNQRMQQAVALLDRPLVECLVRIRGEQAIDNLIPSGREVGSKVKVARVAVKANKAIEQIFSSRWKPDTKQLIWHGWLADPVEGELLTCTWQGPNAKVFCSEEDTLGSWCLWLVFRFADHDFGPTADEVGEQVCELIPQIFRVPEEKVGYQTKTVEAQRPVYYGFANPSSIRPMVTIPSLYSGENSWAPSINWFAHSNVLFLRVSCVMGSGRQKSGGLQRMKSRFEP